MKKYLFALLFLLPTTTSASIITGTLSASQTWTVAGGPYEVDALTIPAGVTLTVEPGTQVTPTLHWSNEPTYIFKVQGTVVFGSNIGPKITLAPVKPPLPQFCATTTIFSEQIYCAQMSVKIRTSDSLFLVERTGSVMLQNTDTSNINIVIENKGGTVQVDGLKSRNYQFSIYQRGFYQQGQIFGSTTITNSDLYGGSIWEMDVVGGTLAVSNSKLVGTQIFIFNTPYNPYKIQAQTDLRNNWWGNAVGPDASMFASQTLYTPWLTAEPGVTPVGCLINCYSSVMFFPGIMGSKLYEQGTFEGNPIDLQRWSSSSDFNQSRLQMDANGYSVNNLYTKAATSTNTGVIDEILGQNVYKSFMSDLSDLKTSSTIQDYSLIPYDWRLPLSEIVQKGKVEGDKLYYGTTTPNLSDSFIIKELQRLADNSKSGKVTIVAHSNGGLVTKELIQTLKETNSPLYDKIDKVIFVAVPQAGTPEAVTTLLHGSNIGLSGAYVNSKRTRELFQNMPSMYNLLPTESYFNNLSPLIEFNSTKMVEQGIAYGSTINTSQEYLDYIKGTEGRNVPTYSDTLSPAKANQTLLNQAIAAHQRLDNWLPATSTKVYQVAGWGIYTPSGIKYSDKKTCVTAIGSNQCISYDYKTTISDQLKLNGDGTVLSGSAQAMGESSQTENWWVDVKKYNEAGIAGIANINRAHKDILEVDSLRNFIKNLVIDSSLNTQYLSKSEPPVSRSGESYTKYQIHSPLHLTVVDGQGNITGYSTSTSQILEQIKGSQYLESADVKTVILPQDTPHKVFLNAYASGSFTFEASTLQSNIESALTIFEAIPTSTSTVATLTNIGTQVETSTPLVLDFYGNGTVDTTMTANTGTSTLYVSPNQTPEAVTTPATTSTTVVSYSSGGYYSAPIPVAIATSTPILQIVSATTTTTTIATTAKPNMLSNNNKQLKTRLKTKTPTKVLKVKKAKTPPPDVVKQVPKPTPEVASLSRVSVPSKQYMSPWQIFKVKISSLIK